MDLNGLKNNARQHDVCVMCFTAYLKVCASYRAFFLFCNSWVALLMLARGYFIRLAQARLLLLH